MALACGSRIGPYDVLAPLGADDVRRTGVVSRPTDDGQRFVINSIAPGSGATIGVLVNWPAGPKKEEVR